jgi:hypothetical protein
LRGHIATLTVLIIVGAILLLCSLNTGFVIGSNWFGDSATTPWHMNNYIVIEAKYAYVYFGLASLAIGGLATGIAAPALFAHNKSRKTSIGLVCAFFVSIVLTGLGFNTLDFMLGSFYWTNMQYPPPVAIPIIGSVDVWNYYFFFFVVPLWLGGFIMGLATSYYSFVYCPQHLGASLFIQRNLKKTIKQTAQKTVEPREYFAETKTFSRNSKTLKHFFKTKN